MQEHKLRWFGHVKRRNPEHIEKYRTWKRERKEEDDLL